MVGGEADLPEYYGKALADLFPSPGSLYFDHQPDLSAMLFPHEGVHTGQNQGAGIFAKQGVFQSVNRICAG